MDRKQLENWMLDMVADEKIFIMCRDHMYTPSPSHTPAELGCKKCWEAWYTYEIAKAPPDKRQEYLAKLEEIAYPLAELEDKGQLGGFGLYKHPTLRTEKE